MKARKILSLISLTFAGCVGTIDANDLQPDAASGLDAMAVPDRFKAGDSFDYALVSAPTQMVATMITGFGYHASAAPKAIAINAVGLGFVSIKPGGGEGDAERTALEGCYAIGGSSPCALLARGDLFAVNEHGLADAFTFRIAAPATLADLPFVTTSVRTTDMAAYAAMGGIKAVAVSIDGTIAIRASTTIIGNQAEANRVLLERCEMRAALTPCMLFATANTPVLDVNHVTVVPQIDFARTVVQTNLPGTTDRNFSANIPAYMNDLNSGLSGSIYLAADGAGGTGTAANASSARSTALANCNLRATPGYPCFPYATNRTITYPATELAAFKLSRDVHCLAMPRLDCAAHKAIGCQGGMFYTTHGGSVALEACN